MPPGGTPPPLPSPRPRRAPSGSGWKVAAIVLIILLALSLLGNFAGMLGTLISANTPMASGGRMPMEEIVLENNQSRHKIVVVPVEGMISDSLGNVGGSGMSGFIKDQLQAAADDSDVEAVILKINSPGGEVLASDEIYRSILEFQKEHEKPVIASMGSLAASGGYYVAAPCRWIVANDLTITGSIGVIMQSYNYRGLMDKVGLRSEVFKSGRFKDMLSGTKAESDISDEERAMVQRMVDETFGRFKEVVQEGRAWSRDQNETDAGNAGRTLANDWTNYADGRILSGKEAFERGFVDELGNFKTAYERAIQIADISSANVVQYRPIFSLGSLFRLLGQSEAKRSPAVKVDLGLPTPTLQPGLPYFLSPNYVR